MAPIRATSPGTRNRVGAHLVARRDPARLLDERAAPGGRHLRDHLRVPATAAHPRRPVRRSLFFCDHVLEHGHEQLRLAKSLDPDSRQIVLSDVENGVHVIVVIDVDTGIRTRIGPADLDGWDPAWSPDGRGIAFVHGHDDLAQRALYVIDPDGSNIRRLTTIPSRGSGFLAPVWSPSSDRLAFAAETADHDPFQKDIWIVELHGSPEIDVSNDPADETSRAGRPTVDGSPTSGRFHRVRCGSIPWCLPSPAARRRSCRRSSAIGRRHGHRTGRGSWRWSCVPARAARIASSRSMS